MLWAVVAGACLKFVLNEGLARWQLATGSTLLEGAVRHFGRAVSFLFLAYLLVWSLAVGRALASACGITAHALMPVFAQATTGKLVFGALHSVLGVALVLVGGYRLFEKVMSACIVLMVITTMTTAALLKPDLASVLKGLLVPVIPRLDGGGLTWTVALLGGVGGTVTLLCYGYWIREEGRDSATDLRLCRLDLATGYAFTALFGLAMVVVGSTVVVEGGGANLLVLLGDRLGDSLGPVGRWLFLVGAWGAVASSLLGVWQSVPYLFADLWRLLGSSEGPRGGAVDTRGLPYRGFLVLLGLTSIGGLFSSFVQIQKVYAVLGALFIPMLALTLLLLNGRSARVGAEHRSSAATSTVLIASLILFLVLGVLQVRQLF